MLQDRNLGSLLKPKKKVNMGENTKKVHVLEQRMKARELENR